MQKLSFHTFGCKLNLVDSNDIARGVYKDFALTEASLDADIHIINTCAVTSLAVKKVKNLINRLLKRSNNSKIIVIGCAVRADLIVKNSERIFIVDNKQEDIVSYLKGLKESSDVEQYILDNKTVFKNVNSVFRSRVFVKIQEGCNSFCTYCIVPYLRGREFSRSIEDIVQELKYLENNGVEEVVLTGTAIGKFKYGLYNLLLAIFRNTKNIRVRLSSLRPSEVSEEFFYLMRDDRLCPHLHISMQSASDRILNLMNRRDYRGESLLHLSEKYYSILAKRKPFLASDVIVGFPTETESDFLTTYNILKKANMTYLHVFPYSPRPMTPAVKMPQVGHAIIKYRKNLLNKLSRVNYEKALNNMRAELVNLVWETEFARTDNYFKVAKLDNSYKSSKKMFVHSVRDNILMVV